MTWREEQIGDCRLILGDCREVLPTLGEADALVTDPPFGIPHKFTNLRDRRLSFDWDTHDINGIVLPAIAGAVDLIKSAFVFCGLTQASTIALAMRERGLTDKLAVWVKSCPPPAAPGNWWPSGCELAVYAYRAGAYFADDDAKRSNVFTYDAYRHGQPGKVDHPTQKPLTFISRLCRSLVPENGTALDIFMGSGTCGVACAHLRRRFIGVEIEPKYFDIACRRIEQAYRQGDLIRDIYEKPKQIALL